MNFTDLIKDARTKKQVYEVYNNSIKLNNSRNKLEGTSDPQIVIPDSALDQIENNTGEEIKEGEYINVDKGYNVGKEGYYEKDDLLYQYIQLKIAVKNNEVVVKSSEFLLEHTPKTVRNIKDKLVSQIEEAKSLQEKAYKLLLEIERILGL